MLFQERRETFFSVLRAMIVCLIFPPYTMQTIGKCRVIREAGKGTTALVLPLRRSGRRPSGYGHSHPLKHNTDFYSLSIVFCQSLSGRLPYRANNPAALGWKLINTDAPAVTALARNLPEGLVPLLRKGLEKALYNRCRNGAVMAVAAAGTASLPPQTPMTDRRLEMIPL